MRGESGDDPESADGTGEDVPDGDEAPDGGGEPAGEGKTTAASAHEGDSSNSERSTTDDASTAESSTVTEPSGNSGVEERRSLENDDARTDAESIDPSELTVPERSLHPRIRAIWIVRSVLWSLVLGAIAVAATWQWLEITLLAPVALTAVLLVLFVVHAIFRYRAWQYEFREDAIYLERGVLTRVRTVVPFVRIQHVDTARGPIARVAGLSTLVVYTAGSRGADVTIPGIEAERATDHQRRLKRLAIAAEDDTAV